MKWRNRKKCYDCAHHGTSPDFLVTDDPYPIYNREDFCKLGKFNWTWGNHQDETYPCDNCKRYTLSRHLIIKERERKQRYEEFIKEQNKRDKILFRMGLLQKDVHLNNVNVFEKSLESLPF